EGRRNLWLELTQIAVDPRVSPLPWKVLGDFNLSLNPKADFRGRTRITGGMTEFRNCLTSADHNPIVTKLDRILESMFSDHNPSCVEIGRPQVMANRPFRFPNFITNHPYLIPRIREAWEALHYEGTKMFSVVKMLTQWKRTIKDINKDHYSNLKKRISEALDNLTECQKTFSSLQRQLWPHWRRKHTRNWWIFRGAVWISTVLSWVAGSPKLHELRDVLSATNTPDSSSGPDQYLWNTGGIERSTFSVARTWEELRPSDQPKPWYKVVWFKCCIPKHTFTFWVTTADRLPFRCRLVSWGIATSALCCLCNLHDETRDHLFLHCEFNQLVWKIILHRLGQPSLAFANWSELITWMLGPSHHTPKLLKLLAVQATIFFLWKERNTRLHDSCSSTPDLCFIYIDRCIRDAILAYNRRNSSSLLSCWFT
ncbi:unnamed protein product, partial [Thlaspi arvense]